MRWLDRLPDRLQGPVAWVLVVAAAIAAAVIANSIPWLRDLETALGRQPELRRALVLTTIGLTVAGVLLAFGPPLALMLFGGRGRAMTSEEAAAFVGRG